MGCDIHCYIEYKPRPKMPTGPVERWFTFGGRMNPGRNYDMFGFLAGIRGDGPPVVPPSDRGIPDEMAYEAANDWWLFINYADDDENDDDTGMCTPTAAKSYHQMGSRYRGTVTTTDKRPQYVEHPDWHTPSWLTPDEWEQALGLYCALNPQYPVPDEYDAMLAAMRSLEGNNEVRVVFWFDN